MALPLARPARAGLLIALVASLAALAGCGGSQSAGSVDVSVEGTPVTAVADTAAPVPMITFELATPHKVQPAPAPLIPLPLAPAVAAAPAAPVPVAAEPAVVAVAPTET